MRRKPHHYRHCRRRLLPAAINDGLSFCNAPDMLAHAKFYDAEA
jgi:hypothetical protein